MKLISVSDEDAKNICKIGQGADCCIWLVMGTEGFECLYYKKHAMSLTGDTLYGRWKKGLTVAKRDGCDRMKNSKETP